MRALFQSDGIYQIIKVNHIDFGNNQSLTLRHDGYPCWGVTIYGVTNQPHYMKQLLTTGFADFTNYTAVWVSFDTPEQEPPSAEAGTDLEIDPYKPPELGR